jgi:UDP-N-acetylmuramoylalanine--D-glutamate ligase
MTEFCGKLVSVIGAARSGLDAARVLTRHGADVLLLDSQSASKLGPKRMAEIEATGARWMVSATAERVEGSRAGPMRSSGGMRYTAGATVETALPPGTELVITSPGVPKSAPILCAAVERAIPVWSEIELAYRLTRLPLAAITGTNGKTTTTLLLAAMLRASGLEAHIAGNVSADEIKRTLVDAADTETSGVIVAEISSFQLEWVERFAPRVGILTNVTPDHLNRHRDFAEYAATKARLFAAQGSEDWAILNYDNPAARQIGASGLPGQRIWFTRQEAPTNTGPGAWIEHDTAMLRTEADRPAQPLFRLDDIPATLPGAHNIENAMAAGAAARLLGAPHDGIAAGLRGFRGVPHRMEWVADIDGRRYINNSMCTNVAAGISSLLALDRPAIVIAGGADKDLDFAPLVPALQERARTLILIGTAADKMEATLRAGGYDQIERAASLEEAVSRAGQLAHSGDAVILTPVCASFDMFADFEDRGNAFRRAVHALKETAR